MVLKKLKKSKVSLEKRNSKKILSDDSRIPVAGYYTIILFIVLIILDRITKVWAATLTKGIDFGIFAFTYATNTGAGFSILQNNNTLLIWLAVIILGLIIYFYKEFPKLGFIFILSGLVGNLIDRIFYGYVVDFINFKFWPVFNAADSFIFIGVVISIIYMLKHNDNKNVSYKKIKKISKNKK